MEQARLAREIKLFEAKPKVESEPTIKSELGKLIESMKVEEARITSEFQEMDQIFDSSTIQYDGRIRLRIAKMKPLIHEMFELPESEKFGPRAQELAAKINEIKTKLENAEDPRIPPLQKAEVDSIEKSIADIKKKKNRLDKLAELIRDKEGKYKSMGGTLKAKRKRTRKSKRVKR